MNLIDYEFKTVELTDIDGQTFTGYVGDYIYPEDNDPEVEGIIMDNVVRGDGYKYKNPIEFDASEIKSIEILDGSTRGITF